jgi:hypothetical protein
METPKFGGRSRFFAGPRDQENRYPLFLIALQAALLKVAFPVLEKDAPKTKEPNQKFVG